MKSQSLSFGIGYVDQSFAIDAAMRQDVAGPPDPWGKALSFSIGLRYFYDQAAPESAAQPTQF
jgi:hypothetical protein